MPGLPKRNSAPRTPLPLAYPKFAWPFDWPTQMKIPRTAPDLDKESITTNNHLVPLAESSRTHNVNVLASIHPSVCPVGILTMTHQGAACDAASIHFSLTMRRTDTLVYCSVSKNVPTLLVTSAEYNYMHVKGKNHHFENLLHCNNRPQNWLFSQPPTNPQRKYVVSLVYIITF